LANGKVKAASLVAPPAVDDAAGAAEPSLGKGMALIRAKPHIASPGRYPESAIGGGKHVRQGERRVNSSHRRRCLQAFSVPAHYKIIGEAPA
jgi:hypothetical protein